jgi:hypothetical protein
MDIHESPPMPKGVYPHTVHHKIWLTPNIGRLSVSFPNKQTKHMTLHRSIRERLNEQTNPWMPRLFLNSWIGSLGSVSLAIMAIMPTAAACPWLGHDPKPTPAIAATDAPLPATLLFHAKFSFVFYRSEDCYAPNVIEASTALCVCMDRGLDRWILAFICLLLRWLIASVHIHSLDCIAPTPLGQ